MNSRHCCQIKTRAGDNTRRSAPGLRRARAISGWIFPIVTLALLPKCPMCVAAYVALATGIGISLPTATCLRATLVALCVASLVFMTARLPVRRPDFKSAFYPGRDDKSITTLEFDGVELAAIQGLNQKLETETKVKDAEIQDLKKEPAAQKTVNQRMEARFGELEKAVVRLANQSGTTLAVNHDITEAQREPAGFLQRLSR
jgi:hypothetical protein